MDLDYLLLQTNVGRLHIVLVTAVHRESSCCKLRWLNCLCKYIIRTVVRALIAWKIDDAITAIEKMNTAPRYVP